jgi:hypothetical protein
MNGFFLHLIIQHDREDSMVLVKKAHSKWYICRLEQILSFTTPVQRFLK